MHQERQMLCTTGSVILIFLLLSPILLADFNTTRTILVSTDYRNMYVLAECYPPSLSTIFLGSSLTPAPPRGGAKKAPFCFDPQ